MMKELSLKNIEQHLYLKYLDDGLIEIIYGFVIIIFSLGMITDAAWLGGVFGAGAISIWIPLKKKITEPRIGQLQFSSIRRKKINQQYVIFIFLGLITFLGGIGTFIIFNETPNGILRSFENFPLLPLGIIFSLPTFLMGLLNKIIRYYLYGITIIVIFVLGGLLKIDPTYYVMVTGIVIMISGLWLLQKFIKQYPIINEENYTGNNI